MPMDPFSAEIVALVRRMSDEAILALVRNQLEAVSSLASGSSSAGRARRGRPPGRAAARKAAPAPAAKPAKRAKRAAAKKPKRAAGGKARRRVDSAEREQLLTSVEKIVKNGSGMSASEAAKAAGLPQTRVASALKELKLAKRIYHAGDAKTADAASLTARKNASGPARPAKGKGKKKK
jgi:hypothetical protein